MGASNWSSGDIARTKPAAYTSTLTSSTNTTQTFRWMRDGQYSEISAQIIWSGAGGNATFTATLPAGQVADTAYLPGGTGTANDTASLLGVGYLFLITDGWYDVMVRYNTTTTLGFAMRTQVFNANQVVTSGSLNFTCRVPIVGWS